MNYQQQIKKVFKNAISSNIHSYYQSKAGEPVYIIFKSGWDSSKEEVNHNGSIYRYDVSDLDDYSFKEVVDVTGSVGRAVHELKGLTDNEFKLIKFSDFLETVKFRIPGDHKKFTVSMPVPITNPASWL